MDDAGRLAAARACPLGVGLYPGLVGTDVLTGQGRFTLGIPQLSDGIDVVVIAVAGFGALPAGRAEMPTFLSYPTERRLSKHSEDFGRGALEGVARPRGGEQRRGRRGARPAPRAGHPDVGHRGEHPRRVPGHGIQPGRPCSRPSPRSCGP